MMYDGYWIWFIPLAGDLMSVGVVYDKDRISNGPRTREEMEAFLSTHRSSRDLMEGAIFEDEIYRFGGGGPESKACQPLLQHLGAEGHQVAPQSASSGTVSRGRAFISTAIERGFKA